MNERAESRLMNTDIGLLNKLDPHEMKLNCYSGVSLVVPIWQEDIDRDTKKNIKFWPHQVSSIIPVDCPK